MANHETIYDSLINVMNDESADVETRRLKAAENFLDTMERGVKPTPETYKNLIITIWKNFRFLPPDFLSTTPSNKFRLKLWEILRYIPTADLPKSKRYLTLLKFLETENDRNATECLKFLTNYTRTYINQMISDNTAAEVDSFFNFFLVLLRNITNNSEKIMFHPKKFYKNEDDNDFQLSEDIFLVTQLVRRTHSGNEVVECDIFPKSTYSVQFCSEFILYITILFGKFYNNVSSKIKTILNQITSILKKFPDAEMRGENFNMDASVELMALQIRCLQMLNVLAKNNSEFILDNCEIILSSFVNILTLLPPAVSLVKLDALNTIRYYVNTDMKRVFVNVMDKLFEDNIFSNGYTCVKSLRPIACTLYCDIILASDHVISLPQAHRFITFCGRCIMEDGLLNSQKYRIKALATLCSRIDPRKPAEAKRTIFDKVLRIFLRKLKIIRTSDFIQLFERKDKRRTPVSENKDDDLTNTFDSMVPDVEKVKITSRQKLMIQLNEAKILIKIISYCIFNVMTRCYHEMNYNECDLCSKNSMPVCNFVHLFPGECKMFSKVIINLAYCLHFFSGGSDVSIMEFSKRKNSSWFRDEIELIDNISNGLTILHPFCLKEIVALIGDKLMELMMIYPSVVFFYRCLHLQTSLCYEFAIALFEFVCSKLESPSDPHLFNQCVKCFTNSTLSILLSQNMSDFPNTTPEKFSICVQTVRTALVKYFPQLTSKCINFIPHTRSIPAVLGLLKTLFKAVMTINNEMNTPAEQINIITSHQFEIINDLFALYSANHATHIKENVIELFFLYPVKYKDFVLYLNIFRSPVCDALKSKNPYLQIQCIRFIESVLDSCTLDSLEFSKFLSSEAINALYNACRNGSYANSVTSARILGKIGKLARNPLLSKSLIMTNVEEKIRKSPTIYLEWANNSMKTQLPVLELLEESFKKLYFDDQNERVSNAFVISSTYLLSTVNTVESKDFLMKLLDANWLKNHPNPHKYEDVHPLTESCYREAFKFAFLGVFVNYNRDEFRSTVQRIICMVVRHISIIAVVRELGETEMIERSEDDQTPELDIFVLMDSLLESLTLDHSLYLSVHSCLVLMFDIAACVCKSKDRAFDLTFFLYFFEKSYNMCFEDALARKFGGCRGIRLIINFIPSLTVRYSLECIRSILHVLGNLSEVASVTDTFGQKIIHYVIQNVQSAALSDEKDLNNFINVLKTLINESFSIYPSSRKLSQSILMDTYKKCPEIFNEAVLQSRELISKYFYSFRTWMDKEPFYTRVGIIEGMIFFMPRIYNICYFDFGDSHNCETIKNIIERANNPEEKLAVFYSFRDHNEYFECIKSLLRFLASLINADFCKTEIFSLFYKHLHSSDIPIRDCAYQCLSKFLVNYTINEETVEKIVTEEFSKVHNFLSTDMCNFELFTNIMTLFPSYISENISNQFLVSFEMAIKFIIDKQSNVVHPIGTEIFVRCEEYLRMISKAPHLTSHTIEVLLKGVLKLEYTFYIEVSNTLRGPLRQILCRFPNEVAIHVLSEPSLRSHQHLYYLLKTLKHKDCDIILTTISNCGRRINDLLCTQFSLITTHLAENNQQAEDRAWLCIHFVLKIIRIILKNNKTWLNDNYFLLETVSKLLVWPIFLNRSKNFGHTLSLYWKDLYVVIKILLICFQERKHDYKLLFDMLVCFDPNFLRIFGFLKKFLNTTVANTYPIEWKKLAFEKFLELVDNPQVDDNYRGRVIKYVLFYSYNAELEKGNAEELFGSPCRDERYSNSPLDRFLQFVFNDSYNFSTFLQISIGRMLKLLIQFAHRYFYSASDGVACTDKTTTCVVSLDFRLKNLIGYCCDFFSYTGNNIDLACKYYRYLLFAYCMSKFRFTKAIMKSICIGLIKAHYQGCQTVVREALDILIPVMANDRKYYEYLFYWIEQLVIEEFNGGQILHVLQIIIRHQRAFYPVIGKLFSTIVSVVCSMSSSKSNNAFEHRKLAMDLIEMLIRWVLENNSQNSSGHPIISKQNHSDIVKCMIRVAYPSDGNGYIGSISLEAIAGQCLDLLKVFTEQKIATIGPEVNIPWFEEIINESEKHNYTQLTFTYVVSVLSILFVQLEKPQLGQIITIMQSAIMNCFKIGHSMVCLKAVHAFIRRIMIHFQDIFCHSKVVLLRNDPEELQAFNNSLNKYLNDSLMNTEICTNISVSILYNALSILKLGSECYPSYPDMFIAQTLRCLKRMEVYYLENHRYQFDCTQHINVTDLISLSIGVIKNRYGFMNPENQRQFILILQDLISPTADSKICIAIIVAIETWINNNQPSTTYPQTSDLFELVEKMVISFEDRPLENIPFYSRLLNIVIYIFTDPVLKNDEQISTLYSCFMCGLKYHDSEIRGKFLKIFDDYCMNDVYERLIYFTYNVNWEPFGSYYWIPICLHLLFKCCDDNPVINATPKAMFPSVLSLIQRSKTHERDKILKEAYKLADSKMSDYVLEEFNCFFNDSISYNPDTDLETLITKHCALIEACKDYKINSTTFLNSVANLCFYCPELAHRLWLDVTGNAFIHFTDTQKQKLGEISQGFLNSGYHYLQKGTFPNAIHTIFQMYMRFGVMSDYEPVTFSNIGLNYQTQHDCLIALETMLDSKNPQLMTKLFDANISRKDAPITTIEESLLYMYKFMREDDYYYSYWLYNTQYKETRDAILTKQFGIGDISEYKFSEAIDRLNVDLQDRKVKGKRQQEMKLIMDEWINCVKELNYWKPLVPQGENERYFGLDSLEACLRTSSLDKFAELLPDVEERYSECQSWRVNVLKSYYKLMCVEDNIIANKGVLDEIESISRTALNCILESYRNSSRRMTLEHAQFINGFQILVELSEGTTIINNLFAAVSQSTSVIKGLGIFERSWKTRAVSWTDSCSDWSLAYFFRKLVFKIVSSFISISPDFMRLEHTLNSISDETLSILARLNRKRLQFGSAIEFVDQMKSGPNQEPTVCQSIEYMRCYLKLLKNGIKTTEVKNRLLELINSNNSFDPERDPSYYDYRRIVGRIYAHLGDDETAMHHLEFCADCGSNDSMLRNDPSCWGTMADIYASKTTHGESNIDQIKILAYCYQNASRIDSTFKSRCYVAKCLHLLYYDDEMGSIAHYISDNLSGNPISDWLPWSYHVIDLHCSLKHDGLVPLIVNIVQKLAEPVIAHLAYLTDCYMDSVDYVGKRARELLDYIKGLYPVLMYPTYRLLEDFNKLCVNHMERLYKLFNDCLDVALSYAYSVKDVIYSKCSPQVIDSVREILDLFEDEQFHMDELHRNIFFKERKNHFAIMSQEEYSLIRDELRNTFWDPENISLQYIIKKSREWVLDLEARFHKSQKKLCIENTCPYLSLFSPIVADIVVPDNSTWYKYFLEPKYIFTVSSHVELVLFRGQVGKKIKIFADDGKKYVYMVLSGHTMYSTKRNRSLKTLLNFINEMCKNEHATMIRKIKVPTLNTLVYSAKTYIQQVKEDFISFDSIYKTSCELEGVSDFTPIARYYDYMMEAIQNKRAIDNELLMEWFNEISTTHKSNFMTKYFQRLYDQPSEYWYFRKTFSTNLAVIYFISLIFSMETMRIDKIFVDTNFGSLFMLDWEFKTPKKDELSTVFRITPNILSFLGSRILLGPLFLSMISLIRVSATQSDRLEGVIKLCMEVRLREEFKNQNNVLIEALDKLYKGVDDRLEKLQGVDNVSDNKVNILLRTSAMPERLCQMDPSLFPHF